MKYLFIDTCTSHLIVSLIIDGKIVSYFNEKIDKGMSNYILPEIEKQLKDNNLEASSIDAIFVSNGPGSFTGIRVGLTISKVYAWSLNIKVIPISSLEVLASTNTNGNNLAIMDARRGYVYLGGYDNDLNSLITDSYVLYDKDKCFPIPAIILFTIFMCSTSFIFSSFSILFFSPSVIGSRSFLILFIF